MGTTHFLEDSAELIVYSKPFQRGSISTTTRMPRMGCVDLDTVLCVCVCVVLWCLPVCVYVCVGAFLFVSTDVSVALALVYH